MTVLSRSLQPPRPSLDSISLDDEFRELEAQRKAEWIAEAMTGRGPFWTLDGPDSYDCEQYVDLFPVIAAMLKLENVSDADRFNGIRTAVLALAQEYAERRCER